jgi:hypothetical protein
MELLAQLIPLVTISIPFAIGNGFVAKRLGRSPALWVILSLIPLVNFFFTIYVAYTVVLRVLERLDGLSARLGAGGEAR